MNDNKGNSLKQFYSMREIGEILSVNERTVRNWINQGKLEAVVFDGMKRVSKKELNRFIKERTIRRKEISE